MQGAYFENFDDMRESLRKEFEISHIEEFAIKFVNDDGSLTEMSEENWHQIRELGQTTQIQLAIELTNLEEVEEEAEPSDYEEDAFEADPVPEKVFSDPVSLTDVKDHFVELGAILQIKKIKKGDSLKYILHGLRDAETSKKQKKITLETLTKQLKDKIGFTEEVSSKLARFLIETPNEEGKVLQLTDSEFKGQTHAQAAFARRKDIQGKFLSNIKDYALYNGLAITSMLSRLQSMFEDYRTELKEELGDADYDEAGVAPWEDVKKAMKLVGLYPDSFDEELGEFLVFMAMRPSKSLREIAYEDFCKMFEEDYSLIEDKKSIWENLGEDGEAAPPYEPSSDEGELESDKEPVKLTEGDNQDENANGSPTRSAGGGQSNVEDLEQNELLEKVDEILMQIVQRLPPTQKIRTLT